MYSTTQNSSGAYDVFQNGAKIATGSSDILGNYGLSVPQSAATKVDPATPATSPVTSLSTNQGAKIVAGADKSLANLTATPTGSASATKTDTTKTTPTDTAPAPAKVTLLNPATGQSSVFDDASLNKDAIQSLMNSGYQVTDTSGGTLPSWLVASTTGTTDPATTPEGKAKQAVDDASNDLKNLTDSLSKYTVSDAQLQSQISSITSQWDARIADMQKINQSRTGNITTTGLRLGSQYAGGSGGTFGGIVSEEERQGVARIGDLEAQKQAAISAARTAAATQNWTVYSKQVDLAEKAYSDKITALKDLQTATATQNKAIADALQQQKTDTYNQVTKPIQDIAKDAADNGADPKTIAAINAATDVNGAINAAGESLQKMTGDFADYPQYKKDALANGLPPLSATDWLTKKQATDAKQKASEAYGTAFATAKGKAAAEAQNTGPVITSPVTSSIGITYNAPASVAPYVGFASNGVKYVDLSNFAGTPTEKNQAVQDAQRAGYKIITNKNSALDVQNITDALSKLDTIQQAFDKANAGNAAERNLYAAAFNTVAQKLQTDPNYAGINVYQDAALDILKAMSGVQGFRGGTAMVQQVKDTFPSITNTKAYNDGAITNLKKLITVREEALVGTPSASDAALVQSKQSEANLTTNLSKLKDSNPKLYTAASNMYTSVDPATGQPYTPADILQAFPELISK